MNARKMFTFIVGAVVFVARVIRTESKDADGMRHTAAESLAAGRALYDEAERQGIAPTNEEINNG